MSHSVHARRCFQLRLPRLIGCDIVPPRRLECLVVGWRDALNGPVFAPSAGGFSLTSLQGFGSVLTHTLLSAWPRSGADDAVDEPAAAVHARLAAARGPLILFASVCSGFCCLCLPCSTCARCLRPEFPLRLYKPCVFLADCLPARPLCRLPDRCLDPHPTPN